MVQLTETGDRTSRFRRAIEPNASLASFAVSDCRRGSPTPNPHPVVLRYICLLAGASVDFDWAGGKIDIAGRYMLWCIGN